MTPRLLAVGADIECVAVDATSGAPKSLIGSMPGTKEAPHKLGNAGAVQMDGVLVEYNIPPAYTAASFSDNLLTTQNIVRRLAYYRGCLLNHVPSAQYALTELLDPYAQRIGCDGDIDAWTGEPNLAIDYRLEAKMMFKSGIRTTGGHIHFSIQKGGKLSSIKEEVFAIVKQLDLYIGLKTLLHDYDTVRRSIYGTAGSCRLTEYADGSIGGEYRVPSSDWASPKYLGKLAEEYFLVVSRVVSSLDKLPPVPIEVQDIINNGRADEAEYMLNQHKGVLEGAYKKI